LHAPKFDDKGRFRIIDCNGKTYYLSRKSWEHVIKERERDTVRLNFDKIVLTITYPDKIRKSKKRANCKILYKEFDQINIRENITVPWKGYFAVVIDRKKKRILTIYPTRKIQSED
jgi:hypothetical protein